MTIRTKLLALSPYTREGQFGTIRAFTALHAFSLFSN